jgi:F-type H+-transporting ATPase subunit b
VQKHIFTFLILLVLNTSALAAGGADGHDHIPWNELIIPQIINLIILATALAFALKGPVKAYFAGRAENFAAAKAVAEKARQAAELAYNDVKERIAHLENTAKTNLQTATLEAAALKKKIIEEAKQSAHRFEQEAQRTAQHELQKATLTLRSELLNKSLEIAEKEVQSQLDSKTQQELQAAFVSRAQGVRL